MTRDPIADELFRSAIVALANEMNLTICRTACFGVLKNIMDCSTAICARDGALVAEATKRPPGCREWPALIRLPDRHKEGWHD